MSKNGRGWRFEVGCDGGCRFVNCGRKNERVLFYMRDQNGVIAVLLDVGHVIKSEVWQRKKWQNSGPMKLCPRSVAAGRKLSWRVAGAPAVVRATQVMDRKAQTKLAYTHQHATGVFLTLYPRLNVRHKHTPPNPPRPPPSHRHTFELQHLLNTARCYRCSLKKKRGGYALFSAVIMINAFLVFNGQGQPRLTKFYTQLVSAA